MPMIEAVGLTKYYGNHGAVREVSFAIESGETVGFLGPNGAGKSTTMRMLTGFLPPTRGRASIAGFDVQTQPLEARRRLGYMPESTPLYRDMRVREFLDYRARLKQIHGRSARRAAITEAMRACWLEDVERRIIGHLSKGYRQRVGLADCLLAAPPLLILDEPTVGLDPNQVQQTRGLIQEIGRDRTVFLSTHILHEVEMVCQRVVIIHRGRLVAVGRTEELCARYAGERFVRLQVVASEAPRDRLLATPKVLGVESATRTPEGAWAYRLRCAAGSDPRHDLARAVMDQGWLLAEMQLEPVRLEQIFAQLTRGAVGESAAPARAGVAGGAAAGGEGRG